MNVAERTVGVLLILGALVTAAYWWSYFSGGDVMVLRDRWYTAFESSFPVADGWMALCMLVSGIGFLRRRSFAAPFGLMAGSALLYLAAMDIAFDVENGMYALARTNDAMKFEAFINTTSVLLGLMTLAISLAKLRKDDSVSRNASTAPLEASGRK